MAWSTVAAANFVAEGFNASERAKVTAIAAGDDGLAEILTSAIAEWRGAIEAAGGSLGTASTVPAIARRHLIAQARWQLLIKFPALKSLQTEERKLAAEKADEVLKDIATGKLPVDPPTAEEVTLIGGCSGGPGRVLMASDIALPFAATPVISGTAAAVTLTCATTAAAIYYTTDGSTPVFIGDGHWENNGTLYSDPFAVDAGTVVQAVAAKTGFQTSTPASATIS